MSSCKPWGTRAQSAEPSSFGDAPSKRGVLNPPLETLDVRWIKKLNDIKSLPLADQQEINRHKEIEITVNEVQDETDYLLSSPANREHLLRAIENVKNNDNLVQVKLEDL